MQKAGLSTVAIPYINSTTALDLEMPHAGNPVGLVTVSIGVAACHPGRNNASGNALIEAADKALYRAKDTGRNQVCADPQKLHRMSA